ncbi:MAG: patatin-like protein [Chlorobiaceae bacterium]|nr:patatin-like protein [Chlorobiaceae bacterium]
MYNHSCQKSEVRFAVVMYGGVSLAIYMNGIAQELLRMVRATAVDENGRPLKSYKELDDVELVYRKLAYCHSKLPPDEQLDELLENDAPLSRTFVIDIVSGTSAGGINGIFLAKAIANGQKIDVLKDLWITEGDVELLINDHKSTAGTKLQNQKTPASLFNSQRMYLKLLDAFEKMEKGKDRNSAGTEPLARKIDLFVTATDILGLTLPIRLKDSTVYERRHKMVFRFSRNNDPDWNDFGKENNRMLAFAARSTSSFPFAFEPMRLCDIDGGLKDEKAWKRFFRGYPDVARDGTVGYQDRPFGDGGYLDNKPFSYAIETINERDSEFPVERKLLYIEPVPDHPETELERSGKPNAIDNTLDALIKLPRYETIREDLEKINERNRITDRVDQIIRNMENDRSAADWIPYYERGEVYKNWLNDGRRGPEPVWAKPDLDDQEWGELDLIDMTKRKGPGYIAYHRLEIDAVTDDFGRLLTRLAGFEENSDYFLVFRYLVRAWKGKRYADYRNRDEEVLQRTMNRMPDVGEKMKTMNQFLHSFDLTFPLRRLRFLRRKIDQLYLLGDNELAREIGDLLERNLRLYHKNEAIDLETSDFDAGSIRKSLIDFKRSVVNDNLALLTRTGRELRRRSVKGDEEPGKLFRLVSDLFDQLVQLSEVTTASAASCNVTEPGEAGAKGKGAGIDRREPDREQAFLPVFTYLFRSGSDGMSRETVTDTNDCLRKVIALLDNHQELMSIMNLIGDTISESMKLAIESSDRICRSELGIGEVYQSLEFQQAHQVVRMILRVYYQNYSDIDRVVFPILYGTGIDEAGHIDILRLSPCDARCLIDERSLGLSKLAGTALGNFGGFMDRRWRQNDIMWGQLDGAERIITALMPDKETAGKLTGEAQATIVYETIMNGSAGRMGKEEANNLLVEPFMHASDGTSVENRLSDFLASLKGNAGRDYRKKLDAIIDDGEVRDHYRRVFTYNRQLEPASTLRSAARASTVTGKLLSGIADQYNGTGKRFSSFIVRAGTMFAWLVEAAVPRSMARLIFVHWIKLLYLLEVVLFAGSWLLVNVVVQRFAITAFVLTMAMHMIVTWLNGFLLFRKRWTIAIKGLAIFFAAMLVGSGGVLLYALFSDQNEMLNRLAGVHQFIVKWFWHISPVKQ